MLLVVGWLGGATSGGGLCNLRVTPLEIPDGSFKMIDLVRIIVSWRKSSNMCQRKVSVLNLAHFVIKP